MLNAGPAEHRDIDVDFSTSQNFGVLNQFHKSLGSLAFSDTSQLAPEVQDRVGRKETVAMIQKLKLVFRNPAPPGMLYK